MRSATIRYDAALLERICRYFQQFMPLAPDDIARMMPYCEFRQFEKRKVITQEGEVENYLNLVVNGLVMKYVRVKKAEVILQLATEGHVISSELSFLSREASATVIETLEPTLFVSMSYEKMELALEEFDKGEELGRRILENMYIRKEEKKFAWQSMGVRERFIQYITNHPHMLQRVPQKYLASYLSIKPETFSRLKHLTRTATN
jgi:CRP-like cAMP-binding protein